jgi:hypothetical protein
MKILSTVFLAHLLCASAFGLHGVSTSSATKKMGFARSRSESPMVQAVDVQGRPLTVSSADDEMIGGGFFLFSTFFRKY